VIIWGRGSFAPSLGAYLAGSLVVLCRGRLNDLDPEGGTVVCCGGRPAGCVFNISGQPVIGHCNHDRLDPYETIQVHEDAHVALCNPDHWDCCPDSEGVYASPPPEDQQALCDEEVALRTATYWDLSHLLNRSPLLPQLTPECRSFAVWLQSNVLYSEAMAESCGWH
jgi:hypothetical protein